jgi:hypothetical protein
MNGVAMKNKSRIGLCVLGLAWALSAGATSACVLVGLKEEVSTLGLADRASVCMAQGKPEDAGRMFYAYQARARALALVDPSPSGWAHSAQSVQIQLGAPVNRWLGGDIEAWMSAIEWALAWDAAAPWEDGAKAASMLGASRQALEQARASSRLALSKLRLDLSRMDRSTFKAQREKAGLGYRGAAVDPDKRQGSNPAGPAR